MDPCAHALDAGRAWFGGKWYTKAWFPYKRTEIKTGTLRRPL